MPRFRRTAFAGLLAFCLVPAVSGAGADPAPAPQFAPHVVVATLDTGANPLHPAWQRDQSLHPSTFIPGYPADAQAVTLSFEDTFEDSREASLDELAKLKDRSVMSWFPGTNLIGTWAHPTDQIPIFQTNATGTGGTHQHGASASSQIAGIDLGMAPEAFVVIMDRTPDSGADVYLSNAEGLRWAADQPWIDIIHTNIQNPVPLDRDGIYGGYPEAAAYAVSKGKIVVSAGGNFYAEATETSPHAGPPGVFVAGANDNCGYTEFSNPDPHVVMDGANTVSAHPNGFGTRSFGGTSSASPRISGYVAKLLFDIRTAVGYVGGIQDGALVVLDAGVARPSAGPLADGRLTAAELQELVRKTANPNPHASRWDGTQGTCIPQPAALPAAFYPKMGYGEVSEHTIGAAFDVALGRSPMPSRPIEDRFYDASETMRAAFWD